MLIVWFPSLCTLRQYKEGYNVTVYVYTTLYYNYIPLLLQYHKLYINTHLPV